MPKCEVSLSADLVALLRGQDERMAEVRKASSTGQHGGGLRPQRAAAEHEADAGLGPTGPIPAEAEPVEPLPRVALQRDGVRPVVFAGHLVVEDNETLPVSIDGRSLEFSRTTRLFLGEDGIVFAQVVCTPRDHEACHAVHVGGPVAVQEDLSLMLAAAAPARCFDCCPVRYRPSSIQTAPRSDRQTPFRRAIAMPFETADE